MVTRQLDTENSRKWSEAQIDGFWGRNAQRQQPKLQEWIISLTETMRKGGKKAKGRRLRNVCFCGKSIRKATGWESSVDKKGCRRYDVLPQKSYLLTGYWKL